MPPLEPLVAAPKHEVAWGNIVRLLLAAALLYGCWTVTGYPDQRRDFLIFYHAAILWAHGANPYDPAAYYPLIARGSFVAYVYPPDTLWVFRICNLLPYPTAALAYMALQLGLAGAIYACWRRFFLPREDRDSAWFAAFCGLGLCSAVGSDLLAGNISLVEQAFLWVGLAAYLRGRYGWFCLLLFVAGAFKLTLLAFSVLLLAAPVRQWGKFALFWAALAARLALVASCDPALFAHFLQGMQRLNANPLEDGGNNPSVYQCLQEIGHSVLILDDGATRVFALVSYAFIALTVAGLSWRAWRGLRARPAGAESPEQEAGVLTVCLFTLVYALLVPRLKVYSCIVLLLPLWRLAREYLGGRRDAWIALIALGCLSDHSPWPLLTPVYWFLWRYQAIVMTFVVWGGVVLGGARRGQDVLLAGRAESAPIARG